MKMLGYGSSLNKFNIKEKRLTELEYYIKQELLKSIGEKQ